MTDRDARRETSRSAGPSSSGGPSGAGEGEGSLEGGGDEDGAGVGVASGVGVGVGSGVALGAGVAVGSRVGSGVAVGAGVGAGEELGDGDAVGPGPGAGLGGGDCVVPFSVTSSGRKPIADCERSSACSMSVPHINGRPAPVIACVIAPVAPSPTSISSERRDAVPNADPESPPFTQPTAV